MTKNEVRAWLRKIYKSLEAHEYVVVFIKTRCGLYGARDDNEGAPYRILLNLEERSPLLRTILHECIHGTDDQMTETRVREIEKQLWAKMTSRQAGNLLKRFIKGSLR